MERQTRIVRIASALMDRNRYRYVPRLLERISASREPSGRVCLAHGRYLLEQGLLREAYRHFRIALVESIDPPARTMIELWVAFLALYGLDNDAPGDRMQALCSRLEAVLDDATAVPELRAFALRMEARVIHRRVITGAAPYAELEQALRRLTEAAGTYRVAGDVAEALRAELRRAAMLSGPPRPDLPRAHDEYARIEARAEREGLPALAVKAALEGLRVEHAISIHASADQAAHPQWVARYADLTRRYRAVRMAHPDIAVEGVRACVLMDHGLREGAEIVRVFADRLARCHDRSLQRDLWHALARWHEASGDPVAAGEATQRIDALDAANKLPMAEGIKRLARAERAMREGNYGIAEEEARRVAGNDVAPELQTPARLILANVLNMAGRNAESLSIIDPLIRQLDLAGNVTFLREALEVRLAVLMGGHVERARDDAERLMRLDIEESKPIQQAAHLAIRAHLDSRTLDPASPDGSANRAIEQDFREAEQLLSGGMNEHVRHVLIDLHDYRAQFEMRAGRLRVSDESFEKAEALARRGKPDRKLAFVLVRRGLNLIGIGRALDPVAYETAKACFIQAIELFEELDHGGMLWKCNFHLSLTFSERHAVVGETPEARRARYCEALERLARSAATIDTERTSLRRGIGEAASVLAASDFNIDKSTVYREAIRISIDEIGDPIETLKWIERGRGRVRLDGMADKVPVPRELQQAPGVAGDLALRQRKHEADSLEDALTIQREINRNIEALSRDPKTSAYAALRSSEPPPWPLIRDALAAECRDSPDIRLLLVVYYRSGRNWMMIGVRDDWPDPRWTRVSVDTDELDSITENFFQGGSVLRWARMDPDENEWAAFAPLVAPLAEWSHPGDRICLVPHDVLHALPIHALHLEGRPLGERNAVGYVSSLAEFYHRHHRRAPKAIDNEGMLRNAIVLGNPTSDLPGAECEARAIQSALQAPMTTGADITREAVLSALEEASCLVYCGHGEFASTGGMDSSLKLGDYTEITASDVLSIAKMPELVVLSACRLAAHERKEGDELLGMMFALSVAGARAIVAAQWEVNDAAAAFVGTRFFEGLKSGRSPAESLRLATIAARAQPGWRHFYYWGAFALHGIP